MITSEQIRGARAMLGIEQSELAEMAQVSLETIEAIEEQPGPISAPAGTLDAIQKALESAGVEFIDFDGRPALRLAGKPQSPVISDEAALPEIPKGAEKDYNGSAM
jgi:hypothetical protein